MDLAAYEEQQKMPLSGTAKVENVDMGHLASCVLGLVLHVSDSSKCDIRSSVLLKP